MAQPLHASTFISCALLYAKMVASSSIFANLGGRCLMSTIVELSTPSRKGEANQRGHLDLVV